MASKSYFASLIIFLMLFTGCTNDTKQKTLITDYYNDINNSDYQSAYKKLDSVTRGKINQEDFELYQKLNKDINETTINKIANKSESKKITIDGKEYTNVINYEITRNIKQLYNNETHKDSVELAVFDENNEPKIYQDFDYRKAISQYYLLLGGTSGEGKINEKSIERSIEYFKDALKYDENNYFANYVLGASYYELKKYESAVEYLNTYLKYSKPDDKAVVKTKELLEEANKEIKRNELHKLTEEVVVGKFIVSFKADDNAIGLTRTLKGSYSSKETKNRFITFRVQVKNNDNESRYIDLSMFNLYDDQGRRFDPLPDSSLYLNIKELISLKKTNPGLTGVVPVIFEIPNDVEKVKLKVDSGILLAANDYIWFDYITLPTDF